MKKIIIILFFWSGIFLLSSCDINLVDNTNPVTTEPVSTTEPIVKVCEETGNQPAFKNAECSFVMPVLPDTQNYTKSLTGAKAFYAQTQWIADNKDDYNIVFTSHVGDLVNTAHDLKQWKVADLAYKILDDAKIPYGVTAGNHDFRGDQAHDSSAYYDWPDNTRSTRELYLQYFSQERTSQVEENYGGHSVEGWNSYYYFEGNGEPYMVLFIDYVASEATYEWANLILEENKHIPTIIITHILSKPVQEGTGSIIQCAQCIVFWEKLIYENNQVFMAISGHIPGSGYELKENKYGNDVILMIVDYQGDYNGGNGMMRLLEFDDRNNKISAHSFSPYVLSIPEEERTKYLDKVELIDSRNKYEIAWNFNERFNFRD